MATAPAAALSSQAPRPPRSVTAAALSAVGIVLSGVGAVVAHQTIRVVEARGLLPRWDLATHLGHGWEDYHLLVTGRIPHLLWDVWLQGYWPPVLSLYQVPFYLAGGGAMSAGLWSGLAAFVLTGVAGAAIGWRLWVTAGLASAALFAALLSSSPFLLAYASVTMTETLGALAQLLVVLAYVVYRERPGESTARAFALTLTLLFFTKYNYFILLAVPLVAYEWLERTAGRTAAQRLGGLWSSVRRVLTTPTGLLVGLYLVALVLLMRTGGFEFRALGQRVSVRSVGNSGHVVLYLLLARLWFLHRRGRIDWARLTALDARVRPLLLWFVVPVAIWMASPYPNHIRDFFNLVVNRPMGEAGVESGTASYVEALRTSYFYGDWTLAIVLAIVATAAVRYARQPPVMRWLLIAIPMQLAAIAIHQTRFPRFLHLTVVLLCLAASLEAGRWLAGLRRGALVSVLIAPVLLAGGVVAARDVVGEERFRAVAFELYTDSPGLRQALTAIRDEIGPGDRLVIAGQNNELSPALFRWELGPPSGEACYPFELGGANRLDIARATQALLIEPIDPARSPLDRTSYYLSQRESILRRAGAGEFSLTREFALEDLGVVLRLFARTTAADGDAPCR
jgi:hypothetical protein